MVSTCARALVLVYSIRVKTYFFRFFLKCSLSLSGLATATVSNSRKRRANNERKNNNTTQIASNIHFFFLFVDIVDELVFRIPLGFLNGRADWNARAAPSILPSFFYDESVEGECLFKEKT